MSPAVTVQAEHRVNFLSHLAARDRGKAIALVLQLLDDGVAAQEVVADLLAPVQRDVGRLWETGEWSVAQEHVATGITDDVLQAVSFRHVEPATSRGRVLVACMEGEYHAMPARMLAEVLRAAGFTVIFVGASLPTDSLSSVLAEVAPMALAISCSLSSHLLSAAAGIDIAHAHGVPAICGGAAFGIDARRATALGADAWASSAPDSIVTLERWAISPPALNMMGLRSPEAFDIVTMRDALIVQACADTHSDAAAQNETKRKRVITELVDSLTVAVRLNDPSVVTDHLPWSLSAVRGTPDDALALLRRVLPEHLTQAHAILAAGS